MSSIFDYFWTQIKIPKRKRNAETFFQRELSLYVLLLIVNFYEQFSKLFINFQGNNVNLSLKITYKDKISDIIKDSV